VSGADRWAPRWAHYSRPATKRKAFRRRSASGRAFEPAQNLLEM